MPLLFIYVVALLEGFSTLAVEIIAIRLALPVVGSSIILTSIFLGVILLALSAGYYVGGIIADKNDKQHLPIILGGYLLFSTLFYYFLTFGQEAWLIERTLSLTGQYILTLFLVAVLLFFLPVFVASQTLPILTELIPEKSKGKAAGIILFASTIGSFLGSVLTSIVFFEWIGVQLTGLLVAVVLLTATALVRGRSRKKGLWAVLVVAVLCLLHTITGQDQNEGVLYEFDSAYQHIQIRDVSVDDEIIRIFHTNGAYSSALVPRTEESPFRYINEAVKVTKQQAPQRVLVIGTAGFTYPQFIAALPSVQQIDAVDIDPHVQRIAERYFLEQPLDPKITFYPQSARYFVNQAIKNKQSYDLIFVDAFNGKSLPDQLTTQEFFASLYAISSSNEIMFNFILDTTLSSGLARNLLTTLASLGPVSYRDTTQEEKSTLQNFIVTTFPSEEYGSWTDSSGKIYTDNLRTTELDTVALRVLEN